jgi:hypothetical protein
MGLAGTAAKLLASLDLDTKPFERGARRAGVIVGGMEKRFGKLGGIAAKGVGNVATNLTRIGIAAAGAIGLAVRGGIQSLADLERVTNATGAVIESTGGKAGVTAAQVRTLAESLEKVTTADDKVIEGGQGLLLTFTNIGKDVFPQASKAMVDMSIAMAQGDVANADFKSSAIQIGKALQDPIKGVTALRKVGVALSVEQQKQINTLLSLTKEEQVHYLKLRQSSKATAEQYKATQISSRMSEAQKIILQELEVEFGKAGEAAGKGFGADLRRLDDAFEDSRMALATGFLPVIRKVADKLTTELVKPEVQKQIQDFGTTLAGAFDRVLEIGSRLPWQQIGDSLKVAGQGAKAVFDAFAGLPPWIQTAVLTGWGLNKLSGGALGSLVTEGIKLTFGQFAARGATPANPLFVSQVGGIPGAGGAGGLGAVGTAAAAGGIGIVAAGAVLDAQTLAAGFSRGYEASQQGDVQGILAAQKDTFDQMLLLPPGIRELSNLITTWGQAEVAKLGSNLKVTPQGISPDERQSINDERGRDFKQLSALEQVRARAEANRIATVTAKTAIVTAGHSDRNAIVTAIRRIPRPSLTATVIINGITRKVYTTGSSVGRTSGPTETDH